VQALRSEGAWLGAQATKYTGDIRMKNRAALLHCSPSIVSAARRLLEEGIRLVEG